MKKKNNTIRYSLYIFLLFCCLFMEIGIASAESLLYHRHLKEFTLSQTLFHWFLTCLIWGFGAVFIYRKAVKPEEKTTSSCLAWKNYAGILIFCLIYIAVIWQSCGYVLKPYSEFRHFQMEYGAIGFLAFLIQHIYYIFESILISLLVYTGQKLGDGTGVRKIPWGGFVCGMLWGLPHALSLGFADGLLLAVSSGICFGFIHLFCKKDYQRTFIWICIAFLL